MSEANDNRPTERWLPVVGFEEGYEVSDLGSVRSLDRLQVYEGVRCGKTVRIERHLRGKLLRPGTVKSGHQIVILGRGNPKLVHSLVLTAFVGPRPAGHDSCHNDGNPANNSLGNLRWGTRSENVRDAMRHGTAYRFENRPGEHPNAILTANDVVAIRSAENVPTADLAARFGVSRCAIKAARSGRSWSHLTDEAA